MCWRPCGTTLSKKKTMCVLNETQKLCPLSPQTPHLANEWSIIASCPRSSKMRKIWKKLANIYLRQNASQNWCPKLKTLSSVFAVLRNDSIADAVSSPFLGTQNRWGQSLRKASTGNTCGSSRPREAELKLTRCFSLQLAKKSTIQVLTCSIRAWILSFCATQTPCSTSTW